MTFSPLFFEDPEEPIVAAALKNGKEWGYWADMQLRDPGGERGGWFIEMGGLNLFNGMGKDGKVRAYKGKYIGPSPLGQGYGRFLVEGGDGVDPGIYHVNVSNIDSVKGVLSEEYLRSLGRDVPAQKEGIVDLSKTRIDPITEQDLQDANIEPDKPKNLKKAANDRGQSAKKLKDLKDGDILYDEGNKRFGEVVSTVDKDGNFSPWVKWEDNQISQIPNADPETETAVWAAPAPEVDESAAPKKTVKGRDLKVGDVIRAWDENRTITAIEPGRGGERYFIFDTPDEGEDGPDGKFININEDVELGREEAPVAPAAPVAAEKTKSNKVSASEVKKGDSVVINGETYTVSKKSNKKADGVVIGHKIEFRAEDGSTFEEEFLSDDTLDIPAAETATKEEKKTPRGVLTSFVKNMQPGDVLIAGKDDKRQEVLFVSAEPIPPVDNNDIRKRYNITVQRADGGLETIAVDATNGIPQLAETNAKGKTEKVNRKDQLKVVPSAPATTTTKTTRTTTKTAGDEAGTTTTTTPRVRAPEVIPTTPMSTNPGDTGEVVRGVNYEIMPDGRIKFSRGRLKKGSRSYDLITKVLPGEITRSGNGKAFAFFEKPEGGDYGNWFVRFEPIKDSKKDLAKQFLDSLRAGMAKEKVESSEETGSSFSGAKNTKGSITDAASYEVDENGTVKISGLTEEQVDLVVQAMYTVQGTTPLDRPGSVSTKVDSDKDEDRAAVLKAVSDALGGTPAATTTTTTTTPDFDSLPKTKADPEAARKAGFTVDNVKPVDIQVGDYIISPVGYWTKVVGEPSIIPDPRNPGEIAWAIPTENYKGERFTQDGLGDLNLRIDRVRGPNHVDTPETADEAFDKESAPFPMDTLRDLKEGIYAKVDGMWKKITKVGKPQIDPSVDTESVVIEFEDGTKKRVDERDGLTLVRKVPEGEATSTATTTTEGLTTDQRLAKLLFLVKGSGSEDAAWNASIMGDARRSLEAAGIDENDFLDYAEKSGASDLRQPDLDKLIEKYKADKGSTTTTATTTEESDKPTDEQRKTIDDLIAQIGDETNFTSKIVTAMLDSLTKESADMAIDMLKAAIANTTAPTTTTAPAQSVFTPGQIDSVNRRINLLTPEQQAKVKEAMESATPKTAKDIMSKIINTLDNAEIISRIRKGMPVDDILARRKTDTVGANLLFDLDRSPKEIAQRLATYKPTVNLDGTPIADAQQTTTTVSGDDTKSVSSLISDVIDSLAKDLQTKFGALKYRYSSKTPQNAEQAEKDHEIYLEYLSTVVPAVMQALKERLDSQTAAGNPDAQKNYDDAVSKLKQELWGQNRGAVYTSEAEKLVGSDRTKEMSDEANKALNDLLAGVKKPEKQVTTETTTKDTFGKIGTSGNLTGNVDYSIDKFGQIALTNAPEDFDARMAESRGLIIVTDNGKKSIVLTKNNDENRAAALNLIKERLEGPAPVTTKVETQTEVAQDVVTGQERPEGGVSKKISELNVGDRLYDEETESMATVVGVYEDPDRAGRIVLTIRFDDGREDSASYKKSYVVEAYPSPEAPAATTTTAEDVVGGEDADTSKTEAEVVEDSQVIVEQGESTTAEPGSTVLEEPDAEAVEPVEPKRKPRGPRKPRKVNLSDVSDEEREAFIRIFDALENFNRVEEEYGGKKYDSKWYIDEKDRKFDNKDVEELASQNTKGIGEDLGIQLMDSTTDAYEPGAFSSTRQPTPGAFTGRVARMVEGKTKAETRNILKGLKVSWFDTETTGISNFDGDPTNNDVVQVGIVNTQNGEVLERLNIYINPGVEDGVRLGKWATNNLVKDAVGEDGQPILGPDGKPTTEPITNEWLSEQMSIADAVQQIMDFMGRDPILGGQNVPFDLQVLQRMLDKAGVRGYRIGGTIDSKDLSEEFLPKYNEYEGTDGPKRFDKERNKFVPTSSLGYVAEFLGFGTTRWHSADADAEDAWKLASATMDRAASEDPTGTSDLMNQSAMRSRYTERMAKFLKTIDPRNPSTAKQHGAVRKEGFGEYLDDLGLSRDHQNALFDQIKQMTRGEAARFISTFIEANPLPKPSAKPSIQNRVLDLNQVTKNIKNLERLKSQPLPSALRDMGTVPTDTEEKIQHFNREFSDFLKKKYPDLTLGEIWSSRNSNIDVEKDFNYFSDLYQKTMSLPDSKVFGIGNATITAKDGILSKRDLAIVSNALEVLQERFSLGETPIDVRYMPQEELDRLAEKKNVTGSAYIDEDGAHIIISERTLGVYEKDGRSGKTGSVSAHLATVIHEYGHLVHALLLGSNFTEKEKADLAKEFQRRFKKTRVTDYGETSTAEKFAELFYDMEYSRIEGTEPAVPEFSEFMESIKGRKAAIKPSLLNRMGIKKPQARQMPPENTKPEFDGATKLSGANLAAFEGSSDSLRGSDQEAGYIPDPSDQKAFNEFRLQISLNPGDLVSEAQARIRFKKEIEKAKKDARRYEVLKVEGTNSYIRYKNGDASPEAIQQTIDQLRDLEDFNVAGGISQVVTLAKRETFSVGRLFATTQGTEEEIHGYSLLDSDKGIGHIVVDPDLVSESPGSVPGIAVGQYYANGGVDAQNMLKRTLVHEYAHNWAKVILGHRQQDSARFDEFVRSVVQRIQTSGGRSVHPISEIAEGGDGESFAEFFTAAFFQIVEGRMLPTKGSPLDQFIQFFAKYAGANVEPIIKNISPIVQVEESSSGGQRLKFPKNHEGAGSENVYLEYNRRREFYRNGLDPYGRPLSDARAAMIREYSSYIDKLESAYQSTMRAEDFDVMTSAMAALKRVYDSMFFAYAKNNSRFNVDTIGENIEANEQSFRSWTAPTSPLFLPESEGPFKNEITTGRYTDVDGISYPLVYISSTKADGRTYTATVALDPENTDFDLATANMDTLIEASVGKMITISDKEKTSQILDYISVDGDLRHRGIATSLLSFTRSNTTKKVLHKGKSAPDVSAWAQSVDSSEKSYESAPRAFDDASHVARHNRNAINLISDREPPQEIDTSSETLEAEALHYAGENYGNFYHPNLQDYMSKQGGGLGVYNSTVGYVSAETLSSMRGNEPKDPDSVARKVEDLQDGDGFDQPVSVVYNPRTGEAYVADGNHRVQASLDAGVAYVPTRVFIMDVPPAQENPQIKKLERDGGLPLPEGADEVHPYFVFNKEDLVNGKDLSDPSVVEEMASNVVVWSGRGKASERNRSGRYDPDPNNIFEQLAPGEYVMDKKTKKIYQVYSQDFTTEVGQDGVERAVFTGKIVVREFEGNLDNLSRVRISTQFGDNNIRYAQGGQSSADDSYNDARSYIDEIRDPADFENVTDSFIKLSDQPILISDTMYVVQTETGIKGRISKFVSPGVVRLDVLKGYNEDGEPLYDQIESPITQLLPIQNQQQVPNGQPAMEHAPDMQISNSTWDSINTLSSTLLKWGYLSEDKYKAIQTLVHGKFITQSGALDLERSLRNHDVVRRAKIRGVAVKSPATGEPVAQAPVQQAAPSAPAAPSVGQGEAGGRSFEQLLEMKRARKKADAGLSVEEFASPVTKIKVTKNPPTQSQILEVERLLSEDGAVTPQRAFDILSSLPTLNAEATEAVLEEIRADVLNKRISKDESITGLVVPKGFNRSKISGYQPAVEESSTGFEIDRDAEEPNEDGEVSPGAKPEEEGPKMSFNAQQKSAIDSVVSSEGGLFFITGGAGTGKTTIKKEIDKREKAKNRRTMTIAPTGKAALQAEGATIHSTFKIPVGPLTDFSPSETYNKNMGTAKGRKSMAALRTADTIFIDEVSMVRADLMDAMDRMLRVVKGNMSEPFGGAKIVMLGDLAQLPPVGIDSSPENQGPRQRFQETYADDYFLSANSWASSAFEVHNLTESMRQSAEDDAWFEQFLRERARFAEVTQEDMEKLWEISEKNRKRDAEEGVTSEPIHLVSTNAAADEINKKKFAELEGEAVKFTATIDAPEGSDIKPFVRNGGLPKEEMEYKIGEPVMFIKNDDAQQRKSAGGNLPNESRWVNGSQGVITRFEYAEGEDGQTPIAIYVKIGDKEHRVVPATWEDVEYGVSTKIEEEKNIVEGPTQEVLSTYTQIPLMPGWAMTTHKSQGATMDSAVVDYSIKYSDNGDILTQNSPFAAGQVYVALSRLRSSNGLYLTRKLNKNDFIRIERSVTDFFKNVDAQTAANQVSESSAPKKFDPLKGYISEVDLASALDSGELTGPAGQNLTDYQSTAIKNKLRLMRENPNSADRYREEIAKLMNSWFGVEEPGEEIPAVAAPIEIRMDNFRDPSERQATIDLLTKSGIPYTLKYD